MEALDGENVRERVVAEQAPCRCRSLPRTAVAEVGRTPLRDRALRPWKRSRDSADGAPRPVQRTGRCRRPGAQLPAGGRSPQERGDAPQTGSVSGWPTPFGRPAARGDHDFGIEHPQSAMEKSLTEVPPVGPASATGRVQPASALLPRGVGSLPRSAATRVSSEQQGDGGNPSPCFFLRVSRLSTMSSEPLLDARCGSKWLPWRRPSRVAPSGTSAHERSAGLASEPRRWDRARATLFGERRVARATALE